jgi:hypothetical protein
VDSPRSLVLALLPAIALCAANGVSADAAPQERRIAYALTSYTWEIYQVPGHKTECPDGFNDGPREQFAALFPDNGTKRKLVDTQLLRENQIWRPDTSPDVLPYKDAKGAISYGMNLDGEVSAGDFTSPDGETGVDNQMYRAVGCIANFNGAGGTLVQFTNQNLQKHLYNRVVIELTDVDSLTNDDSVTVTSYRGREPLMTNATGQGFLPGGTQTVDTRWGKSLIHAFKGRIVDGVLITEPGDFTWPASGGFEDTAVHKMRGMRLRLNLTPERAEGLMAGYADVETFHLMHNKVRSTHLQSYGQQPAASLYKAMYRLADGYPDPATGANTAISAAITAKFTQVFLRHPPQQTSMEAGKPAADKKASKDSAGR